MSSEWPRASLREFVDLLAGFAFKSSGYTDVSEDVRLLRGDNIAPGKVRWDGVKRWPIDGGADLSKYVLEPGDVVLAMDRPWIPAGLKVAQVTKTDTPSYLVQRVARLRAASRTDCDFLFALLSTPDFDSYIQNVTTGTAVPHISAKQILDYEFRLPPASARAEIGTLVAEVNDRITLLCETNTTLEAIAQALFKSWFVDFDPVRAKMAGRAPEGMDEATAALFPDGLDETELGLVPKGWRIGCVEELCSNITNGGTPSRSKPNFWDGGSIPWFKTGEFHDGFLLKPSERITDDALSGSSVKLLPKNAILMAIYAAPTVGRLGILTEPATFNQACTGMVAKAEVGPWFLFWTLFNGRDWFNSRANGAAQQNISKAIVAAYRMVIPSQPVFDAFNRAASTLHDAIQLNAEKSQTLSELRDTLLPRLISGQLRVPEVQDDIRRVIA